jgi:gamma-glutamylcyclotransferase (GGCT)/AIG2-like uncharacterized protein YtfP
VHGLILTFAEPTILTNLDKLEDYDPARPAIENDYIRKQVMTYTPEGISWIPAWAYFITLDRYSGILIPDGD